MCKYAGSFLAKEYDDVRSRQMVQNLSTVDWNATRVIEVRKTRLRNGVDARLKSDDFDYLVACNLAI